ncbi:UNVERIFIED_CONTAM: hypothetical protein FKN15_057580 [Acipenser sinensis]
MADEATRRAVSEIPLLKTNSGPRDKELWVQRLREEYLALIKRRNCTSLGAPWLHSFPVCDRAAHSFSGLTRVERKVWRVHVSVSISTSVTHKMADEATRRAVSEIPLLKTNSGPRDKELWVQRLREEYLALIKYVENNKQADNDWFRLESNKEGTRSVSRGDHEGGCVVQWVKKRACNQKVPGSNPISTTDSLCDPEQVT